MILKNLALSVAGASALLAYAAPAYATKALTSPYVTKGRATSEWRGGYDVMDNAHDVARTRLLQSYGVTDWWDTRIAGTFSHNGEASTDALSWENKFQLTEKGALPIDLGLRLDYSYSTNAGVDKGFARLLAAKKIGPVSQIANFSVGRELGEDHSNNMTFDVAYGAAYDLSPDYALGVEYYGDFADFDNTYSEQVHQVGPVLYGTEGMFKYQVGALAGISEAAPDVAFKATMSYSFDLLK